MRAVNVSKDEAGQHSLALLKNQSLRVVAHSLSSQRFAAALEASLRGFVEEGAVWRLPFGAEMVVWRARLVFCSDDGLCMQRVRANSKLPFGDVTVIPFHAISKVTSRAVPRRAQPAWRRQAHGQRSSRPAMILFLLYVGVRVSARVFAACASACACIHANREWLCMPHPPAHFLLAHLVPITLSYTPLLFAHVQLLPCPHILASSISSPAYLILTVIPLLWPSASPSTVPSMHAGGGATRRQHLR
jgi:hypothetical protein